MAASPFALSPELSAEDHGPASASRATDNLLSQSRDLVKLVSNPDGSTTRMVQEPDGRGWLRVTVLEKANKDGSREAYSFRYDKNGSMDFFTHTTSKQGLYHREQWARESKYGWNQVDVYHKESDSQGHVLNMHHLRRAQDGRTECLGWIQKGRDVFEECPEMRGWWGRRDDAVNSCVEKGFGNPVPELGSTSMTIVPRADRTITITGYVGTPEDNCPTNCRRMIRF